MKKLATLALSLALACPLLAERVDVQKASNVAKTAMQNTELVLLPSESFENLYVFNAQSGFVIVAADDCVKPILAYSPEFPFKVENMPGNLQSWLSSLNAEIQYAIDMKLEATEEIRREWNLLSHGTVPETKHRSEVKPFVFTHWNQRAPYNNLCPEQCLTGCVATAMAQIMKYWEWPNQGVGYHSYDHPTYGPISVVFNNTVYDWDNMVDQVFENSPMVQQTAVSTLMYHCGVSINMNYGLSASMSYVEDVLPALWSYFDYNQADMQLKYADDYNAASWMAFIKSELDAKRPILYRGADEDAGHAFVCDGYDANDYLHFNWGWGGYCDGYYAYGALNPGAGGAGSGNGSYNNFNYLVSGIHPNTPPIAAPINFSASALDQNVTLHWTSVSGASHYKVYRDGFVIDNHVTGTSFTDSNVIYGNHVYYVKAVNSIGVCSLKSEELPVEVSYPGPVPAHLIAVAQDNDVHLNWTAPASESSQLKYGDGEAATSSYGSTDGFSWGQRFTPEQLSPYAGMAITSVEFYSWKVSDYVLSIYREVGGETELLATQPFSNYSSGWFTVNLTNPIPLDYENNLLVTFYNDCSTYQYVAAYMPDYEGSGDARLYKWNGQWYPLNNNVSWLIKTNISDGTYTYSVFRDEQQIAANVTQTNYVDSGLQDGFYQYTVRTQYYGSLSDASNIAPVIIGASDYSIANVTVTEPSCNGGDDGAVSVDITGGYMPLTIELGTLLATVSEDHCLFEGVSAGVYPLQVVDNMGFALACEIVVGEPEGLYAGEIATGSELIVYGGTCSMIQSVQDATSGQATLIYRWKRDGAVIDDSNTAQYTPVNLSPGTYSFVREVKDDCTDWMRSSGSWKVKVSQNDVDENDASRLEVYPNPTHGKVTVHCEHMESIAVVSTTGQQLATVETSDDHVDVDMADFQPGVYVMVIRTRDGVNRIRVVRD